MALYFASRGRGTVRRDADDTREPYTSTARVLLSGLGSDELLGGYSRHRRAFEQAGWNALVDEVCSAARLLPFDVSTELLKRCSST